MPALTGYTKLFNSILASTIWREDDKTRIVWITLLAMADQHGVAEGSIPGIADFARVSVDDCRRALQKLSDPDRDSRSQEFEGRRIEPVDGGWRLLNHNKYRRKMSKDERREYLRVKQREYRASQQASTDVNNVSDSSTLLTQAEAEADTKAKEEEKNGRSLPAPSSTPMVFPLKNGESWELPEIQERQWGERYRRLDVKFELSKALSWLEASPAKQKTARGMCAFLVGWLNRAAGDVMPELQEAAPKIDYRARFAACAHQPRCGSSWIHERQLTLDEAKR